MKPEPPPKKIDADYSEKEIARRRDEVARRMLNTPYSPQTPMKTRKKKKTQPVKA